MMYYKKGRHMKKVLLPFLLVIILLFTGCSTSFQIGAIESNSSNEFHASYYDLSGSKVKKVTVKEGKPLDISMDIVTKKGTLDVLIYKDKNDNQYEGHALATTTSTVTLSDPGTYTIKVIAKKHRGSYTFKW